MLAQLMAGDASSRLVALDRTAAKVAKVQALADSWGVGDIVQALTADATQLYQQGQGLPLLQEQPQQQHVELEESEDVQASSSSSSSSTVSASQSKKRKRKGKQKECGEQAGVSAEVLAVAGQPESFDAVLLDAPCSALGLRPRLLMGWGLPALTALAAYQRALLHSAVHLLKPGGSLVYCTCSINPGVCVEITQVTVHVVCVEPVLGPANVCDCVLCHGFGAAGENEANVRYVLDKWPGMKLVEQPLVLGGPGLVGPGWLTAAEAQLVQRFDPGGGSADDTIGFFIAKFVKQERTV